MAKDAGASPDSTSSAGLAAGPPVLGHPSADVGEAAPEVGGALRGTLEALARVFPYPAYVFDAAARLTWCSAEGTARLEVVRPHVAGADPLDRPRLAAALGGAGPEADQRIAAALRAAGLFHTGERTLLRRYQDEGAPLTLVMLIPALAGQAAGGALTASSPVRIPGLAPAESRVATLAAEGFTVTNIAARLEIGEPTVRTHLRRLYRKLHVHSRAELACILLRGAAEEKDGEGH